LRLAPPLALTAALVSLPPAPEKAVHCEMDRDLMVGEVKCTACGERWSNKIHDLSEAIDVYSEWIDACEAANAE
jgi:transcription elongation factor Elf1